MRSVSVRTVLMFAVIGVSSCHRETPPPAPAVQAVKTGTVTAIEPNAPERFSATIAPNLEVALAFKSPGLVESVYHLRGADGRTRMVEIGDKVAKGVTLATVRRLDYRQKVEQARAAGQQAEAQLAQAQAALGNAQANYRRAENLYRTASLTRPDYDQAKAQFDSTSAQVLQAKAAIESARTQVSETELSLQDTVLKAPLSGYVTARNVSEGSVANNSTVAFSLIDTSLVKAYFSVPDTSLRSVRVGRKLPMTLDALSHPVTGTVTAISPQADTKSRVFSVEVTIPNATNAIRPGMIGNLALGQGLSVASRVVVPIGAVVRAPNSSGFAVFRVRSETGKTYADAQAVQLGNTYGNAIEITSGLRIGEQVVVLGGELLTSGQQIRIVP